MSMRTTRRSATRTAAVVGAVAGALLLAGCTSPLPAPDPDPTPSEAVPALTTDQMAEVRTAVGTALEQASTELDRDAVDARLTGPARKIRRTELLVAEVLETTE